MTRIVTWGQYRESIGDRSGLFAALVEAWPIETALYPGSYVDLSPSTAIPSVTYVDTDARAAKYFADHARVRGELDGRTRPGAAIRVDFLSSDYTRPLAVTDGSVDLLISLYSGPVSDHCRRYLRRGGWLLANSSHGDASLAALDPTFRLVGVVECRGGRYSLGADGLEAYLVPKRPEAADGDLIRRAGKGIAYTRPAFAYLFQSD